MSGLVIGASAAYLALKPASFERLEGAPRGGERPGRPDNTNVAAVAPQVPVDLQTIPDHDWWAKEGFAEMVLPVHLPTNGPDRHHIRVWLKIPDGRKIAVRKLPDGTPSIRFPSGTRADRVESHAVAKNLAGKVWPETWTWTVGDVRGTTLTDTGELFHVFVPSRNEPRAPLSGWEWRRGVEAQQRQATQLLVQHLKAVNVDDPIVTVTCPDGTRPELQQSASGDRRHRCAKGSAVGVRDVKAGVARKDPATLALCQSRKYLWDHMDADERTAFAASFDVCGIR